MPIPQTLAQLRALPFVKFAAASTDVGVSCWSYHCPVMYPEFVRRYDFGTGAGFYLNATEGKWQQYRMYDYVTKELPAVLRSFPELDVSRVRLH